jgi:hypothetical protein
VAEPVCKRCNDTHLMTRGEEGHEREVMCTFCPTPCEACRAGGFGAFCEKTPCECACHVKTAQERPARPLTEEQLAALERDYTRPGQVHEDVRSLLAEVRRLQALGAREIGIGLLADAHLARRKAEGRDNPHDCPTCVCGRRAPVQGDYEGFCATSRAEIAQRIGREPKGPGTIAWKEHLLAYNDYSRRYGTQQSAERLAERGGFGFGELIDHLGREPLTWAPVRS